MKQMLFFSMSIALLMTASVAHAGSPLGYPSATAVNTPITQWKQVREFQYADNNASEEDDLFEDVGMDPRLIMNGH